MGNFKYECVVCDERRFTSRADWLFHLVLERHSLKAQENKQKLYLQSGGNWLVISEIGRVEKGVILDYVASRLPSFSNFFSFRPQANLCVAVCTEGRDLELFTRVAHIIDGIQPSFRDYNEIPFATWNSYFIQNKTDPPQLKVKKEPTSNFEKEETARICSSLNADFTQNHAEPQVKEEPGFIHQEDDIVSAFSSDTGDDRNSGKHIRGYGHGYDSIVNPASGSKLREQETEGDAVPIYNKGNSIFKWLNSMHSNSSTTTMTTAKPPRKSDHPSSSNTVPRYGFPVGRKNKKRKVKRPKAFKCRWCKKCFYTEKPLLPHIYKYHKNKAKAEWQNSLQSNRNDSTINTATWNSYFIQNWMDPPQVIAQNKAASNYQEESAGAGSSLNAYFPQDHVDAQVKEEPDFMHQDDIVSLASDSSADGNSGKPDIWYSYDNVNPASGSKLPKQEAEGCSGDAFPSDNMRNSSFTWLNPMYSTTTTADLPNIELRKSEYPSSSNTAPRYGFPVGRKDKKRKVKRPKAFKCGWCIKRYYTEKECLLHIDKCHKDQEEWLNCMHSNRNDFTINTTTAELPNIELRKSEHPLSSDTVPRYDFPVGDKDHRRKQGKKPKPFMCRWCNRFFYTEAPVRLHIEKYHKEQEENYAGSGCAKRPVEEN